MNPSRLSVSFPVAEPPGSLDAAIPVFHRLIQRGLVEGLVIDVADYRHVPDGPGVLLVGHDVDYGITSSALTVTRKRTADSLADQFRDAVRMALGAMDSIAYDGELVTTFTRSALTVAIPDRKLEQAGVDVAATALTELAPVVEEIWGEAATIEVAEREDVRRAPRLAVTAPAEAGDGALERLGGARVPGQSAWDIRVEDLISLREGDDDFVLLDVREESELEIATLGGRNIPLADLEENLDQLEKDAHIVVHCRAGRRGAKATTALREAGFENAWNLNGGLMAWRDRVDPTIPQY